MSGSEKKMFCVVQEAHTEDRIVDICDSLWAAQIWCKHLTDSLSGSDYTVKPMPVVTELEAYLIDQQVQEEKQEFEKLHKYRVKEGRQW